MIEPEVLAHYNRWKDDPSVYDDIWDITGYVGYYVDNMKSFAINRHPIVKEHIKATIWSSKPSPYYHYKTSTLMKVL